MKKLTNKQKKMGLMLLIVAAILIFAAVKGKDLKQIFNSLFPDGFSSEETLDTENIGDALTDILTEDATVTPEPTDTPAPTATPEPTNTPTPEPTEAPSALVEEDGVYSTPELVAAYIHTFNKLPSNYITKNEATKLGWVSSKGNLWDVTDEMSIGGDKFGNREGLLPKKNGRQWYECDVNYYGGYRGSERILYSNDGLIYYTDDHYESFTQLY